MASNPNGVLNKVLNFIGLVDDDTTGRSGNYSSNDYGRQEAYKPSRQRKESAAQRKNIPEKGGRSNYGTNARRPRTEEEPQTARRPSRFEEPEQTTVRTRSRFEETDEQPARTAPRAARSAVSSDMLMLSLFTLYDTRAIIKALVKGHTITVSIEPKDPSEGTRIKDTLSGAAFALGGDFRQVGHNSNTYLLTPKSVNILQSFDSDDQY